MGGWLSSVANHVSFGFFIQILINVVNSGFFICVEAIRSKYLSCCSSSLDPLLIFICTDLLLAKLSAGSTYLIRGTDTHRLEFIDNF